MISAYFRETCIIKRSKWFLFPSENLQVSRAKRTASTDDETKSGWSFIPEEMGFAFIRTEYKRFHCFFLLCPTKKPKGLNVKPLDLYHPRGCIEGVQCLLGDFEHQTTKLLVEPVPGGETRDFDDAT